VIRKKLAQKREIKRVEYVGVTTLVGEPFAASQRRAGIIGLRNSDKSTGISHNVYYVKLD